jgi:hypothetical protein
MECTKRNDYEVAIEGYPESWHRIKGSLRWIRALPNWLRNGINAAVVLTIGVQTYAGIDLMSKSASISTSTMRWDCINGSPLAVHILTLAAYYMTPLLMWSAQALNAVIFPAPGVALSVACCIDI